MSNATDMSTPVTRGELRAELEEFEIRLEAKLEQKFDQKLKSYATKADLEAWGGRLYDVIQETVRSSHLDLSRQLASFAKAIQEDLSRQFAAFDDKYKDLPGRMQRVETILDGEHKDLPERVTRLETAVLARKRR